MVKNLYDIVEVGHGTDNTDTPSSTIISQSFETNLDVINFNGAKLDIENLDEFDLIDFNGNSIFTGYVREINENGLQSLVGFDYGIILQSIPIRKNYVNQTRLQIIQDIINNYTDFTLVTTVTDTSQVIPLYPANKSALKVIDDMHKLLGTTHAVDKDKNFILETEGEEYNTNSLTVGVNCKVASGSKWKEESNNIVKSLRVNGDIKRIDEEELFDGTGSQTEYELANPYTDIKVEYPVGTILKPYVEDKATGDYKIFKETGKIDFIVAPANGTDNIKITYTYELPVNYGINTTYTVGTNPYHRELTIPYLKEIIDCKTFAQKYYEKFKNPLANAKLTLDNLNYTDYRANQRILVKDEVSKIGHNINREMIIKEVIRYFGEGTRIDLVVGDSDEFVYDKRAEIEYLTNELVNKNLTAEIFNEGITTNDGDNELEVEYEVTTTLYTATLPSNILVYDASRTYTNESEYTGSNGYKYINIADYEALFVEVT